MNERTEITKAIITWVDAEYEYELEIENEDHMDDDDFTAWIEENAEAFAKEDAQENGTAFEAVSYTHLDVYKRQVLGCTPEKNAYLPCRRF